MDFEEGNKAAADAAKTPWRVDLEKMKERVVEMEVIHPECIPHMTIVVLLLRNGYALQGMSAPADPANFNEELGQKFAYEDALRKMWPLEAYVMRDLISGEIELRYEEANERWNPA